MNTETKQNTDYIKVDYSKFDCYMNRARHERSKAFIDTFKSIGALFRGYSRNQSER